MLSGTRSTYFSSTTTAWLYPPNVSEPSGYLPQHHHQHHHQQQQRSESGGGVQDVQGMLGWRSEGGAMPAAGDGGVVAVVVLREVVGESRAAALAVARAV